MAHASLDDVLGDSSEHLPEEPRWNPSYQIYMKSVA
jgi:hypothetical protein